MSRPFLIDTDAGSDDAVAILMALRHSDVDVRAITVVAGNVPLAQGVVNSLYFTELCNADVPVHAGADRPLLRQYVSADWFHGADGLGDWGDRYKPQRAQPSNLFTPSTPSSIPRAQQRASSSSRSVR